MRRVLFAAAGVVLLAVAAVVSAPYLIPAERFRPVLQSQLEKSLGRAVGMGALRVRLIPLSIGIDDLRIAEDPAFASSRPFVQLRHLQVAVKLRPLLGGRVEVESLRFREPSVELIHRADGSWNTDSLARQPSGQDSSGGAVVLNRLIIESARIAVTTATRPRLEFSGLNLRLDDLARGQLEWPKPMINSTALSDPVQADFHVENQGRSVGINIRHGRLALRAGGALKPDLDLHVEVPPASVRELAQTASRLGLAFAPGLNVSGTVSANLTVRGPEQALGGRIELASFEISGGSLKQPVRTPRLQLELTPEAIRSQPFEVQTGPTRLNGYFSLAGYSGTPRLEAAVFADHSDLADLVRMAHAWGVQAAEGLNASGQTGLHVRVHGVLEKGKALGYSGKLVVKDARFQPASFTKPIEVPAAQVRFEPDQASVENATLRLAGSTMRGELRVRQFAKPHVEFQLDADRLSVTELRGLTKDTGTAEPSSQTAPKLSVRGAITIGSLQLDSLTLTEVKANCALESGVLQLDPASAAAYAGRLAGAITADLRSNPPVYKVRAKIERADSSELVAAMTPMRNLVTGPLAAAAELEFSPQPGQEPSRSLNGTVSMKLADGKLLPLNILGEVGRLAKFLNNRHESERATSLVALTGDLAIRNGVADTENLRLDLGSGSAVVSGRMNLADQALNLKMITTLTKALSDEAGGSRIGGYLTAAVTNNKGELVIPTVVAGTFARPLLTPDAAQIAKLKLQYTVPELTKSPGTIIDAIKGNKEGVRGIIDALGGRRKQ
jgi:uncharacterized protein involved in outer membrane biogenesis